MVASCLLCARRHDGTFCQGARGVLKWSPSLDPWPSRPACPSRSYSASRRLQALLTQGQEILAYATDFNSSRCTARNHGSDTRLTLPFCVPASCKHILQQSKLVHARSFEGSGANATSTAHPREPQSRTTAGRIVKFFARDQPCRQFGSNHDRQANPLMFSVGLLKILVSLCQSRQHASSLRIWRRQGDAKFSAKFRTAFSLLVAPHNLGGSMATPVR